MLEDGVALDPAVEAMIDAIRSQPIDDWGIFITKGPTTAQAKKPDATYRTVPLIGTEEFVFAGLRMGKRGKLIFEFRPIDPTYMLFEWDEDKVFDTVVSAVIDTESLLFEERIEAALGFVDNADSFDRPGDVFKLARSRFCAAFRKKIVFAKKEAEAQLHKANEDRMAENPLFGLF